MNSEYPLFLANRPETSGDLLEVRDKFHGTLAARVRRADSNTVGRAITAAVEAAGPMARMAPYEREAVLFHCVHRFKERAEELAGILQIEAGKPIQDSCGEVTRLIDTFRIAAREAQNPNGEVLNNEIPFWRVDNLPYGGVKDSGLGREGVRYAIEDMTEIRSLVFRETGDSKSVNSR